MDETQALILETLKEKSSTKQLIYRTTLDVFEDFKRSVKEVEQILEPQIHQYDKNVEVKYHETGDFEVSLKFSGDTLVFMMHTNVFNFPADHFIYKTEYVKEDPLRAYCGVIQVYNFLSDSFKYNRLHDMGYLIARIFVNKDRHFFIEGKRQLGFLYNDFDKAELNQVYIKAIVEQAMLYCMDFDLYVPPFDAIKEISIQQKMEESYSSGMPTAKRLGFQFLKE